MYPKDAENMANSKKLFGLISVWFTALRHILGHFGRKNVPDVGIELRAACMPSELASDWATAPG